MSPQAVLRRHWALVGASALVTVVLCAAGLAYTHFRSEELAQHMRERLPPVINRANQLVELMRMRATLEAALARANDPRDFPSELKGLDLSFMRKTGESNFTAQQTAARGLGPAYMQAIESLPTTIVKSALDKRPFLWPDSKPTAIVYCSRARGEDVVCAYFPLTTLMNLSSGIVPVVGGYEFSRGNQIIAVSEGWPASDPKWQSDADMQLGDLKLHLRGRAGWRLKEASGMRLGQYFAATSLAIFLGGLVVLFTRREDVLRQLALQEAVRSSRAAGEDLVRATLRTAAEGAGVLVWLLHEDERLELIGPWAELAGMPEGETTLEISTKSIHDAEAMRAGLREAIRSRRPWSRILAQDLDGETRTYQSNCSPLIDKDGRFIAMLGITSDITEALRTQSRIMRDDAYRSAQGTYLRHLAKSVSGPAMHVQAVVDRLRKQLATADNPELQQLLSMAAAEVRRLSDVVRGSVELTNLRGTDLENELRPTVIDELVVEVVNAVASREGLARRQTVEVDGTCARPVLTHHQSFVAMLNIVLENAFKYSPADSVVRVHVREDVAALHIDVDDAGPGMRPDEIAKLGEPFFRGVSSIGTAGGGLGIATALELAHHLHASIRFLPSSDPARGLLVSMTLPWAK